jgi:hypothetical protein
MHVFIDQPRPRSYPCVLGDSPRPGEFVGSEQSRAVVDGGVEITAAGRERLPDVSLRSVTGVPGAAQTDDGQTWAPIQ